MVSLVRAASRIKTKVILLDSSLTTMYIFRVSYPKSPYTLKYELRLGWALSRICKLQGKIWNQNQRLQTELHRILCMEGDGIGGNGMNKSTFQFYCATLYTTGCQQKLLCYALSVIVVHEGDTFARGIFISFSRWGLGGQQPLQLNPILDKYLIFISFHCILLIVIHILYSNFLVILHALPCYQGQDCKIKRVSAQ